MIVQLNTHIPTSPIVGRHFISDYFQSIGQCYTAHPSVNVSVIVRLQKMHSFYLNALMLLLLKRYITNNT